MRKPLLLVAAGAALAMSLTACGSTVQLGASAGPLGSSTSDASGLGLDGGGVPSGSDASDAAPTGISASQSPGTATTTDPSESGSTGSDGATDAPVGGGGSGGSGGSTVANTKPISVGVVAIDYTGLAATFGVSSGSIDYFGAYKKFFAYRNAHGGLGGRQVKATYVLVNGSAVSYDNESQRACAALTEDTLVDVVLTVAFPFETFTRCLKRKGVPQIDSAQQALPDKIMAQLPNFVSPMGVTPEREAKAVYSAFSSSGFVGAKNTLGILTEDCSSYSDLNNTVLPALAKKYSFKVVTAQLSCYQGTADLATSLNQIRAAVLKFRGAGVDRVGAFVFSEGAALGQFASAAKDQKYFPRYAVTSNANPYSNVSSGTYTPEMMAGALGISWVPINDLGPRAQATPVQKTARAACLDMDPTKSSAASGGDARYTIEEAFFAGCDDLLLLNAALTANGGNASMTALPAALARAVLGFKSAAAYDAQLSFTASRRDGASRMQLLSYNAACKCEVTQGPTLPLP